MIKTKDYRTVTYKNVDISVSPELLQDIHAGTQPPSVLEDFVRQEYSRYLPAIRNQKIDLLLNE